MSSSLLALGFGVVGQTVHRRHGVQCISGEPRGIARPHVVILADDRAEIVGAPMSVTLVSATGQTNSPVRLHAVAPESSDADNVTAGFYTGSGRPNQRRSGASAAAAHAQRRSCAHVEFFGL
jgi:hypothetical protein